MQEKCMKKRKKEKKCKKERKSERKKETISVKVFLFIVKLLKNVTLTNILNSSLLRQIMCNLQSPHGPFDHIGLLFGLQGHLFHLTTVCSYITTFGVCQQVQNNHEMNSAFGGSVDPYG